MTRKLSAFFSLLGFCSLATATIPANTLILLGTTRADLRCQLGSPEMLYSFALKRFFSSREEQSVSETTAEELEDVWTEKTPGGEYRLQAGYAFDPRTSRLHPTEKVQRLAYTPDVARTYTQVLADIPEFREMCAQGCVVVGIAELDYSVLACSATGSVEVARVASQAYFGFKQTDENIAYRFCGTFTLQVQGQPIKTDKHIAWDRVAVDRAEFHSENLVKKGALLNDPNISGYSDVLPQWTTPK